MQKKIVFCILIISIIVLGFLLNNKSFSDETTNNSSEKDLNTEQNLTIDEQVEKIVSSMSLTEKLGQMMMIGIQGTDINDDSIYMLNQYHIGGIILFDRNMNSITQVKTLTSNLQNNANQKLPLFIGIDEEGGNVVRMAKELTPPPSQQEIGNSNDPKQAKE